MSTMVAATFIRFLITPRCRSALKVMEITFVGFTAMPMLTSRIFVMKSASQTLAIASFCLDVQLRGNLSCNPLQLPAHMKLSLLLVQLRPMNASGFVSCFRIWATSLAYPRHQSSISVLRHVCKMLCMLMVNTLIQKSLSWIHCGCSRPESRWSTHIYAPTGADGSARLTTGALDRPKMLPKS